jgi:predicted nucleic acid-binding protein
MVVIADTSPINYLAQLGLTDLLRRLYAVVLLPLDVLKELGDPTTPIAAREWALNLPDWIEIRSPTIAAPPQVIGLDPGERAALTLAVELNADIVLVDERKARHIARNKLGLALSGTLGVLREAHRAGWIDGVTTFETLCSTTTFYHTPQLDQTFIASLKK